MKIQKYTCNPYAENTYILYDDTRECVIIDPGMYTAEEQNMVASFIKDEMLNPVLLLNTHAHIDHVLGNKFVFDNWGLKPKMHVDELPYLHAVVSYAPQMGIRYDVSPEPEEFLAGTGELHFGNSKLDLIFAPGHSAAHLCFYCEADQILIAGDVLFYESIGRTDLPGGNHNQLLNSIKTMLWPLPDDCVVYPGHGGSTTIGHEKEHNPWLKA